MVLWAHLGFLNYWYLKDYRQAAAAYLEGSKHPNALSWMKGMAAKIEEEGGSRQASRFLWSQIYETSPEPEVRKNAKVHLQALAAEEDADHLEKLAAEYHDRFGRYPSSERDLVTPESFRASHGTRPDFPTDSMKAAKFASIPAARSIRMF